MKLNLSYINKPQLELPDALYAMFSLINPFSVTNNNSKKLENQFKELLTIEYVFTFNAARSALYILFKSLGIKKGDEVLIQGYTHVSVPNAVLWSGGSPVYVDIDPKTYNMDYKDLESKITKKSKLILLQHTFGLPANLEKIIQIAKKNNLLLVEDCAHALGTRLNGKMLGTFADAAVFSFGATKVIDAASGGVLVTNNKEIAKKVQVIYTKLNFPPSKWTRGQLLFLVSNYFLKPIGLGFDFGLRVYNFLRRHKIIPRMVTQEERQGKRVSVYPALMPEILAGLILRQLPKLDRFNKHREYLAKLYSSLLVNQKSLKLPDIKKDIVYLKFNIQSVNADAIIKKAGEYHLDLNRMFGNIIGPIDTNLSLVGYKMGMCPKAEKVAKLSVDFPTGILLGEKEVKKVVNLFLKLSCLDLNLL